LLFGNAARHVERFGGELLHGWAIWEVPQLMVEAEFHAVWRDPTGTLVDVNPRRPLETRITLTPAPAMRWPGNAIDNIRDALLDDSRVHAFIAQAQRRYELLKEYPPGLIQVDAATWAANFPNAAAIDKAFFLLSITHRALTDPCVCGGPARFGDCHAEEFGRR